MTSELPQADYVLAACNALEDVGRNHLLPEKAKLLAFHLRSALLAERTHRLLLTHVVIQLIDSDARYADPDLVHAMREQLAAWHAEAPSDIGMENSDG